MFIDANVFIHANLSKGIKGKLSAKLLERVASGEQKADTSVLVLNEVLYIINNKCGLPTAEKVWNKILTMPNLHILQIDQTVLASVMKFVKTGLNTTDAFHAATMKANRISTICSFDRDFDVINSIKRQEPK